MEDGKLSRGPMIAITVLRVAVGWHFLYEGLAKMTSASWSAAGYLRASSGPFADAFRRLADVSWMPWLDVLMTWSLILVGLGLILGLFTQLACAGALALLALFYLSFLPTHGVIEPGAEGSYLFVNKNLLEAAAVAVLLLFRTGRIAGLDLLLARPRVAQATPAAEAAR